MLKDKIYNYLKQGTFADLKIVAQDIADICEKDCLEKDKAFADKLYKENAELKKLLDKDRIMGILERLEINKTFQEWYEFKYRNAKVSLDFKGAADDCIEQIANEIIKGE